MTRERNPYARDIREINAGARSAGWRAAIWVLAIVLFAGAISVGIWAFRVSTSDVKGAGDQTRITNDGRNRVNSQEWFEGMYAQILTADQNLDGAAKNLATASDADQKAFWQTNYTGLQNRCRDMVNQYNAEAHKVSRGQWRSDDLPEQIDTTDPRTDCLETK